MHPLRKVLFVGWDSADWRVINPLLKAGELPNLQRLILSGVSGNMATLYPVLSPMLWTSIATGKRPHKHGIHGFTEPDPDSDGVRPITNLSRKTKAVWNILTQANKRCIVIGWWPSHPAEPLPGGVMISNSYQRAPNADAKQPWPMAPGTVHPTLLAKTLAKKRLHPAKVQKASILDFVPRLDEINQKKDRRPKTLAKIIADCANIHSAAKYLIHSKEWDFMAVYYDAIDHFGHAFMRYHPPHQKWISKRDYELYSGVIEESYRYHDKMLGELLSAADSDTTILLMSDHGFHPDNLRTASIPVEPAGPAVEHRHYGIFVLSGPGIKKGERVYGANVLDVCPTLLALFNLPAGQDMDGKPLVTAWDTLPKIETVSSWDAIHGSDGTHASGTRLNPEDHREAFKQLEQLGYVEPVGENRQEAAAKSKRELRYNLACSYLDAHIFGEASEIFSSLWKECPGEHRFGEKLLLSQLFLGRPANARITYKQLRISRRKYSAEARGELKLRRKERKEGKRKRTPKMRRELRRLAGRAKLSRTPMMQLEAMLLLAEGFPKKALSILKKLSNDNRSNPTFYIHLARGHIAAKQWAAAEKAYKNVLKLDSDNAHAYVGLAQVYLSLRRNYEAADTALTGIGMLYQNPVAHYLLGVALHRLGQIDHAIEAMRICISQNDNFLLAHRRLAHIFETRRKDKSNAHRHREAVKKGMALLRKQRIALPALSSRVALESVDSRPVIIREQRLQDSQSDAVSGSSLANHANSSFITIVSGLPRSGTSLMMQMLSVGGLPPLHDSHRVADADNPRGYFEYEPAKNLRVDSSWMPLAKGRVLKLVAQLLPFLPPNYDYRIIFMDRSIEEVLASQGTMLARHGRKGAALSLDKLRAVYEEQIKHVKETLKKRKFPVLHVSHRDAIKDATGVARRLREFLRLPLDCNAMENAIDPTLYRQKATEKH